MTRYPSLTKTVFALMLTLLTAAAAAQAQEKDTGYCNGGPFPLNGGDAKILFAIDDVVGGGTSIVTLRLYNAEGTAVASKKVTLAAGKTVTLPYHGSGVLRAHATFDVPLTASGRRQPVASVVVDDFALKVILPLLCTVQENIGR